MFRGLIIGCGNIGAGYDFDSEDILTHAKAYHKHPNFMFDVYDIDMELATKISIKYETDLVTNLTKELLSQYDCLSICTPTNTHFEILKMAFQSEVQVIICEKPIAINRHQLQQLDSLYKASKTKVLVNFIREFQPNYLLLKEYLNNQDYIGDDIHTVIIRYQRGFINNGSHAFSLLNYLFGSSSDFYNTKLIDTFFDTFEDDPTICLTTHISQKKIHLIGITNVDYPIFELELFGKTNQIVIADRGSAIFCNITKNRNTELRLHLTDCITNYMQPVIETTYKLLTNQITKDNFLESLHLNQTMLNMINNE